MHEDGLCGRVCMVNLRSLTWPSWEADSGIGLRDGTGDGLELAAAIMTVYRNALTSYLDLFRDQSFCVIMLGSRNATVWGKCTSS